MNRRMLIGAMIFTALLAMGSFLVAFASRMAVQETPISASTPSPPIVTDAKTMTDVLVALDLKPVEIIHE